MAGVIGGAGIDYDPNAFLKGAAASQAFQRILTQNTANSQYDPTDPTASVNTLNAGGLYDEANQAAASPFAQQNAATRAAQNQANLAITQQSGQENAYNFQQKQHEDEMAKVANVATVLKRAQAQGQDVNQAYAGLHDYLTNTLGLPEQEYQAIGDHLKNTPGFLDEVYNQALSTIGNRVYDKNTGKVVIDSPNGTNGKPTIIRDASGKPYQVITDDEGVAHYRPITEEDAALGGSTAPAAAAAPAALTEDTFASRLKGELPGAVITSGLRTPEHNAAVGGVPTSNHLTGNAADVVPPPGMTMGELAAKMQADGFHVVNEGNHVHVDFNGAHPGQAPGLVAPANSQPTTTSGFALKPVGGAQGSRQAPVDANSLQTWVDQVQKYGFKGAGVPQGNAYSDLRNAIQSAGAAKYGSKWDPAGAGADLDANMTGLKAATKQTDLQQGYEAGTEAAGKLIDQFNDPKKLGLTNLGPTINGPLLAYKVATGDANAKNFDNFVKAFADEYAKVLSGSTGGAAATDSARAAAHDRIYSAMAGNQLSSVVNGMVQEMKAKLGAQNANIGDIRQRIRTGAGPAAVPTGPAAGAPSLDDIFKGVK